MTPAGWVVSGKGVTRRYDHPSGWRVQHCGHPTALWPWAVYGPDGAMCTSGWTCRLGVAFPTVTAALAHADAHVTETPDEAQARRASWPAIEARAREEHERAAMKAHNARVRKAHP